MRRRRADITIDQALSQMDLASSGSSSESSIADSSDLASFSEDGNEDDYSLDSSALGQATTSGTSTPGNCTFTWNSQDNVPKIHPFTGTPGVKADLRNNSSILDIFQAFIPPEMITLIADETNRYAASKPSRRNPLKKRHDLEWRDVTTDEIKVVLGLCILMGVVQKPVIKLYWSTKAMLATPFYSEVMPRDRFLQILSNMHFANNAEDDGTDRLFKIRNVVETMISNFREAFTPYQNIATDESLLKFHGRLEFKQYNPSKRARFGIKVYKVCQSSGPAAGYTWNMKIYCGQDRTDDGYPASTKVVLDLNNRLLGKGYNIYLDNWYSSPGLFVQLLQAGTNVCGTVRLNRKGMPSDFSKKKMKRGEIEFRSCADGLLALKWQDKKEVKMLSSMHTAEMVNTQKKRRNGEDIIKPQCVLSYNEGMGGVDRSDQRASTYQCVRKCVKWYKKLFFYVVDMCIVNSFLLHVERTGTRITLLDFRLKLVAALLESSALPAYRRRGRPRSLDSPARLLGRHFPIFLPPTEAKEKPQRRCAVCSSKGIRKETRYQCETCSVSLCVVPCFKDYHTKSAFTQ